jgi:hypothetical protein
MRAVVTITAAVADGTVACRTGAIDGHPHQVPANVAKLISAVGDEVVAMLRFDDVPPPKDEGAVQR